MSTDLPNRHPASGHLSTLDGRFPWAEFEALSHRDPGARGLASFRRAGQPLDVGVLRAAALELAENARRVVIVTGFPVILKHSVTAETDGPPGALYLAEILAESGVEVAIVTDPAAVSVLRAGATAVGLDPQVVQPCPLRDATPSGADSERWLAQFIDRPNQPWSHLVAIERPGPSHTVESFQSQPRAIPIPLESFQTAVPEMDRDRCHNMRGESLDEHVAPTHRLFELIAERHLPIRTIAIGDGGNELGMGRFLWEDLVAAIATGPAGKIACRVAAEFALVAGTSNWGAYALALAVATLRGSRCSSRWLQPAGQLQLLEILVTAGAVDGRTRLAEPTVDGLASEDYLGTLTAMWRLLERFSA